MKRIVWLTACSLLAVTTGQAPADGTPQFDRIEEDWELVISEPSPADDSPQILNVISPDGTQDDDFFVFEINHCTQPEYFAGGLQLQQWHGEHVQTWSTFDDGSKLTTPQETITYTLRMLLYDDVLSVTVRDGQSQTWGEFHSDPLRILEETGLTNLNGYRTSNSVAKSRVGFASYRVTRFVLKEVRYYSHGELVQRDETEHVVHEYQP